MCLCLCAFVFAFLLTHLVVAWTHAFACCGVCVYLFLCDGLCVWTMMWLADHDEQLVSGRVFQSCGGDGACMLCALLLRVCVILCLIVCWWSDVCVVGIHVCDSGMCC